MWIIRAKTAETKIVEREMESKALVKVWVYMMILTCMATAATYVVQHYLKQIQGYKLTGPVLNRVSRQGMTAVACAATCQPDKCKSATYSKMENICMTFQKQIYEISITMSVNSTWNVLYKIEDTVQHDQWTLVFRGQPQIQSSALDTWMSSGVKDDYPVGEIPWTCLRLDNHGGCTQHFRSQILDNWVNIKQVRFSLYKNGVEVKYILFDGSGTDKESWFSQSNVLNSSWPGLAIESFDYFSVEGHHYLNDALRHFYTASHIHCEEDNMYTMVIDTTYDACASHLYWTLPLPKYPLFLYSPNSGRATPAMDDFELADVLAVFVKFN